MKKLRNATREEKAKIEDAWLNIDIRDDYILNPLKDIPEAAVEEPYIFFSYAMGRPQYFAAFCKYVMNIDMLPFQSVIQANLYNYKFPMLIASRGGSKSWSLGLYCLLRMVFMPNRKIIVCGAGFRQSKLIFEYMDGFWQNAPLLRDMVNDTKVGGFKDTDMWRFLMNGGYTACLPVGTGDKIRGQRANDLIVDEFSSINPAIFETVMAGFAAVSSDPFGNSARAAARHEAERLGIELEFDTSKDIIKSNQIVISGTAYYSFNHFAAYWRRWKAIINSKEDPKALEEHYPAGIPKDLNAEDYSIIRIPVELIPEDFMDMGQIARTKGSINAGVYANEYGAVFSADSDGFFRRTLIESCIAHPGKIYKNKEDCYFEPRIYGDPDLKYVMGIDPASENDNFSIVLLELREGHRRLVYSWTTTRKNHQARLKNKLVAEHDFYSYVNRKVRDLMERFDVEHIIIDSQGGGYAVIEAFKNEGNMKEYERAILEIRDPDKPKDSDRREGHHIVELASFADAKWFSEANHGMKKDMEDQELIFPSFDPASLAIAIEEDQLMDRVVDTVQDCVEEVELLKDELCTIVMKQTMAGREQFVTPEEVTNGAKRRQKKDRYSSLVIANMAARQIQNDDTVKIRPHIGDFAGKTKAEGGPLYYGNPVYNAAAQDAYKDYD
mgnify:FL=1|tara:strand:- start:7935 stop:9935 length:2001 start_codon:yes stop_codon:yes gene_type:complete